MFVYEPSQSDEQNFQRWRWADQAEHEELGLLPLSEEGARRAYEKLKESGWLTKSRSAEDRGRLGSS